MTPRQHIAAEFALMLSGARVRVGQRWTQQDVIEIEKLAALVDSEASKWVETPSNDRPLLIGQNERWG